MISSRSEWRNAHARLMPQIRSETDLDQAKRLFHQVHAAVHLAGEGIEVGWSLAEEALEALGDEDLRRVVGEGDHSIAWILWHLARIEDVTMSVLVADGPQEFLNHDWQTSLGVQVRHTGNAMSANQIEDLSQALNLDELKRYWNRVANKTQMIVTRLDYDEVQLKVDPKRLRRLVDEGAVVAEAKGLIDYWGSLDVGGLLLMPPTRHCFLHLLEAFRIRGMLQAD